MVCEFVQICLLFLIEVAFKALNALKMLNYVFIKGKPFPLFVCSDCYASISNSILYKTLRCNVINYITCFLLITYSETKVNGLFFLTPFVFQCFNKIFPGLGMTVSGPKVAVIQDNRVNYILV